MKNFVAISLLSLVPASMVLGASDAQTITLDRKVEIPGATLKSGEYTFEIEDRLQDRAIIRITDSKKKSHELLLAVPNEKLNQTGQSQLIFFPTSNPDKKILEGWMCPSCQTALEIVYPKGEAVKITGVSAKPVMAVDPTYDKLPKNLTADDMKVVTLWLLSPKEITADQKGKGVEAAKLADLNAAKKTEVAEARTPEPVNRTVVPVTPSPAAPVEASPAEPSAPEAPAPNTTAPASSPVTAPAAIESSAAAQTPAATPASPAVPSPDASSTPSTVSDNPAPVQASSMSRPSPASGRHMPHTASNTYSYGLVGLLLFAAWSGLQVQRRLKRAASRS